MVLKIIVSVILIIFVVLTVNYIFYMTETLDKIEHMEYDVQKIDAITELRKKRLISKRTYERWVFMIENKL